jgi:4-hydroxybenzoate polyprenyltransferase
MFFNYLQMLRPKDWVPGFFWVPIFAVLLVSLSLKNILIVAIISSCTLAYAFIINNYFDVEIDKKHERKIKANKNPLAQGFVTKRGTLAIIIFLLFPPLVLAAYFNFVGFLFVGLSIITSTLYSIKRIRLKEKTGIDIISHGLMFGFFPFLAGVTLAGGIINLYILSIGFLFFLINCSALLSHQVKDYDQDLGNTKNTTTRIGLKIGFIFFILIQFVFLLCFFMILRHFIVEWWIYYLFMFLLFWIPFDCIIRARKLFKIKYKNYLPFSLIKKSDFKK